MRAVQTANAGLKGIYLSGWQVAADSNRPGQSFPDQSLYPADSAPKLIERINKAFLRADQEQHMEGGHSNIDYFLPIVADCEAGFGGPLDAFERVKNMVSIIVVKPTFCCVIYGGAKTFLEPGCQRYSYLALVFLLA